MDERRRSSLGGNTNIVVQFTLFGVLVPDSPQDFDVVITRTIESTPSIRNARLGRTKRHVVTRARTTGCGVDSPCCETIPGGPKASYGRPHFTRPCTAVFAASLALNKPKETDEAKVSLAHTAADAIVRRSRPITVQKHHQLPATN